MNKKIIIALSWLCVLITMIMIFCFSAEDSKKSGETSKNVVEKVLETVMDKEKITPAVVQKYEFPIRKVAHFGIYMLLGFCLSNAYRVTLSKYNYLPYILAFPSAIIYAVSDEIHQNFIAGRVPSFKDVLIDSSGALIGILIYFWMCVLFCYIVLKHKYKNEEHHKS